MIRPDNIQAYPNIDLKLGIKSSLPNVKSTLALLILIWKSAGYPDTIRYSIQAGDELCLNDELIAMLIDYSAPVYRTAFIEDDEFKQLVNNNQMLKSQLEALIVAFELVWKVAKISFQDETKAASAERTGGKRYPKQLSFTINMDVLQAVIAHKEEEYRKVLLKWLGIPVEADAGLEASLCDLLTILSEGAVFKLSDGDKEVIFNQNEIYEKLLEENDAVDVNGDKEAKGSLRILKSLLADGMNPYLKYSQGTVMMPDGKGEALKSYQKRVDNFLSLSTAKVVGLEEQEAEQLGLNLNGTEEITGDLNNPYKAAVEEKTNEKEQKIVEHKPRTDFLHPLNQIIYGAPGTGKTYSSAEYAVAVIEKRPIFTAQRTPEERKTLMQQYEGYVKKGQIIFTTFHQSYGYEEFIQGIRPDSNAGTVNFKIVDGVFKKIADKALQDAENNYVIIIDEINRGNISKIFGELITLIEEDKRYGELNQLTVTLPLGDLFTVSNNLYIIGTMNSADKSISLIDTALRRRFDFVEMAPDESLVEDGTLRNILAALNQYLKKELRSTDLLIGHSFFIGKAPESLENIMNRNIIPLLYEYFYEDEAKVKKALECLNGTDCTIDDSYRGRLRVRRKA